MTTAAIVCAQKPSTGSSLITLIPKVLMIRQPPAYVPSPIAIAASSTTQSGGEGNTVPVAVSAPALTRASVITPMVFCASLAPWENETKAPDTSWASRNRRFIGLGCECRKRLRIPTVNRYDRKSPIKGDATKAITTGTTDPHLIASTP